MISSDWLQHLNHPAPSECFLLDIHEGFSLLPLFLTCSKSLFWSLFLSRVTTPGDKAPFVVISSKTACLVAWRDMDVRWSVDDEPCSSARYATSTAWSNSFIPARRSEGVSCSSWSWPTIIATSSSTASSTIKLLLSKIEPPAWQLTWKTKVREEKIYRSHYFPQPATIEWQCMSQTVGGLPIDPTTEKPQSGMIGQVGESGRWNYRWMCKKRTSNCM